SLVAEAVALLTERELEKAPLDLILVDMQLPDGTGLEVLRQVKASPAWHMTPVIVLSGETAPGIINEAYALGANCYLPKMARGKGAIEAIRALYQCWIEEALLPQISFADQVQEALARAVRLRARTAQFYLGLARACTADPDQEAFWLERALVEGNMSNLLAFFQGQISDRDVRPGMAERFVGMQLKVEKALNAAEALLSMRSSPAPEEIFRLVLDLAGVLDEEVFAEAFGALLPKSPAVTMALKARAVGQLRELAGHVLKRSQDPELCRRAEELLAFAGRLACLGNATACAKSG
ncbi:MAG TPA: response regulator, partial [Desulfuromonadales bacterium]